MIAAVRGTHDILPGEVERWQRLERIARDVCRRYAYGEIRTPVIEREELFAKGTGASTDIVQKEMYTFTDKGGTRVTLRPEATPSLVRAYVEHGLEQAMPAPRLFSLGPMFRYERPQKGRYRQFHQLDVEAFGVAAPALDAEIIEMAVCFVRELGIEEPGLHLNSVGCPACSGGFSAALVEALGGRVDALCPDCQRRAQTNPLRIFDCKVPEDQSIIESLPHSEDHLCADCRTHFEAVQRGLDGYGIVYDVSHRLVRGLDYYTRTTFEIFVRGIGAQNAVLGGGRYDHLVRQLGGPERAGIGFAAGLERLVLALPEAAADRSGVDACVVAMGDADVHAEARVLARDLRQAGLSVHIDHEARSPRAQMKRADRVGAGRVVILGADEIAHRTVTVRDMATGRQDVMPRAEAAKRLTRMGGE